MGGICSEKTGGGRDETTPECVSGQIKPDGLSHNLGVVCRGSWSLAIRCQHVHEVKEDWEQGTKEPMGSVTGALKDGGSLHVVSRKVAKGKAWAGCKQNSEKETEPKFPRQGLKDPGKPSQ